MLESERTLFGIELDISELLRTYLKSFIRLYNALGGGWILKEEYVEAKNDEK